jgi:hypothetical protein
MGWLARRHGLQANSVTAIEIVTADGELRRVSHEREPELFWALRGGGGNFGVVTALEFDLYPADQVYAGALFFPYERTSEVLHAWREWVRGVPEDVTSVGRVLQVPDLPQVPDIVRGQSFVVVEAAYLGDERSGADLIAPLRELGPGMDTFAMVPPAALGYLHMDPDEPSPYMSDTMLVGDLPGAAIDDLVAVTGPGSGSPLVSVELRHLGGALGRAQAHHGARATLPGTFAMFAGGVPMDEPLAAAIQAQLALVSGALAPWRAGQYANFVEHPADAAEFFDDDTLRRLRAVKAEYDAADLFLANHPVA